MKCRTLVWIKQIFGAELPTLAADWSVDSSFCSSCDQQLAQCLIKWSLWYSSRSTSFRSKRMSIVISNECHGVCVVDGFFPSKFETHYRWLSRNNYKNAMNVKPHESLPQLPFAQIPHLRTTIGNPVWLCPSLLLWNSFKIPFLFPVICPQDLWASHSGIQTVLFSIMS